MNRQVEWKYLSLIIVVFIAACIETDIYLPAFPDMMVWFSTSKGAIQALLTWNFIGICLAGPFYGPISDAIGRKRPLMIALGMFLAGSIVTVFAQTIDQMLWGRIIQGIGSGGCFTLGTAILFDAFQKDRAIRAVNNLNTVIPLIMAVAPMIGGFLNHAYGFRSNFLAITLFVLISFVVCLFLFDETLPKEKRVPFQFNSILKDFKQAFSSLPFWQITFVISLLFGGYIAFLSGTPVLFVVEFGMAKAIFPFIQLAILGGWVAGSLVLSGALARWGQLRIKKTGSFLCLIGGLIFAVVTFAAPQNPYLLTSGMIPYAFGANWIIGVYFPEGMEILPRIKGVAASLLTSARLLLAASIVEIASQLYNGTIYPLSITIMATIIVIFPTLFLYEKRKKGAGVEENPVSTMNLH